MHSQLPKRRGFLKQVDDELSPKNNFTKSIAPLSETFKLRLSP
jgi:hypothetical protein